MTETCDPPKVLFLTEELAWRAAEGNEAQLDVVYCVPCDGWHLEPKS
jgi:hypothetical protein